MWKLDYKESWVLKNWCFWTVVLQKILEHPLNCKEIQPVHPRGNQSWIFTGRTDAEAETPILWPPDTKSWLIWKDPDAGKDWRQHKKGTTEDEMVGWYHWLDGHEFEQALGVGDGQGGLACCSPWGHKESTWLSDWTELRGLSFLRSHVATIPPTPLRTCTLLDTLHPPKKPMQGHVAGIQGQLPYPRICWSLSNSPMLTCLSCVTLFFPQKPQ